MVACDWLLGEVERGLESSFFRERIPAEDRDQIVAALGRIAIMHDDPESPPAVLRDPDDDYLVALARDADVEAIVTGDRDLLEHPELEPPAITPRDASGRLKSP